VERGTDPPCVVYVYAPDRKAERPITHLAGFTGTLQVDGYGGYRVLAEHGDSPPPAPRRSPAKRSSASRDVMPSSRLVSWRSIIDNFEPWLRAKLSEQSKDQTRRSNPLCAVALGRSHSPPRQGPHRDRFQCGGA
jgi:hypothetical protein